MNIGEEQEPIELPRPVDPMTIPVEQPVPVAPIAEPVPVEQPVPAEPARQSIGIRLASGEITPSEAQAELIEVIVGERS
jgi:hypothetical protein